MDKILIKDSFIKGYHIFEITPHIEVEVEVEKEVGKRFDPFAVIVNVPILEKIAPELHGETTRVEKREWPKQVVQDIAGKVVGRIPANLHVNYYVFCFCFPCGKPLPLKAILQNCGNFGEILWDNMSFLLVQKLKCASWPLCAQISFYFGGFTIRKLFPVFLPFLG